MSITFEQFKAMVRPVGEIDTAKADEIKAMVAAALDNPRFWTGNRVKGLEKATAIPEYDKNFRMLISFAEMKVNADCVAAMRRKENPPEPTEEDILKCAYERHLEKVAESAAKKAKAQAK